MNNCDCCLDIICFIICYNNSAIKHYLKSTIFTVKTGAIVDKTQNFLPKRNGPRCHISAKMVKFFPSSCIQRKGGAPPWNCVAVVGITSPVWSAWYLGKTKAKHVCTLNLKCLTKRKCQHLIDRSNSKHN